ncbi:formyltransferase family protein [Azospirillum argentinense]|uniref:Formyltransferase family protein n=1 Tax=Azospirillum argentinense TaxID=2970906 RepID=A0ABW8VD32_9PROT
MTERRVSLFVAGTKGANLLRALFDGPDAPAPGFFPLAQVHLVTSYSSSGLSHDPRAEIMEICRRYGLLYRDRHELKTTDYAASDLVLLAGWQYLLPDIDDRFIVFHDSLLPHLRGFNPTVTALILGDRRVGVTAFRPDEGVDTGPVYGQEALAIGETARIGEVYEALGGAYARLARRLVERAAMGSLAATPQDHSAATYSLWRNEDDYTIDWTGAASAIRRFVDAVSWPYLGARTRYRGAEIRIDRVMEIPDLRFPLRQPGKIWTLSGNGEGADVVCGEGMLRILAARTPDAQPVRFTSLRQRLGE